MNKIFVSVLYIGFLPIAPGTFGSMFGVILGIIIQAIGGFPLLIASIFSLFIIGWNSTNKYIKKNTKDLDPPEIVIDEVVGQLLAYLPISVFIWLFDQESFHSTSLDWFVTFILFRIFDIFKPWPINWADKIDSGLGIMLDDLIAGFYAAILIVTLMFFLCCKV
mgnify:FL=1